MVLGLSAIKPQLTLAVPIVLLAAGRWRIAAAWAATVLVLAAASLITIGGQGLDDYRRLLAEAQLVTNNRYFTLAYFFGAGGVAYAAQVAVTAAAVVGAFLNRHASLARILCLGLVASALGASYWHLQDFAILVCAAWFFWREETRSWQRAWLLVAAIAGELAWPLSPAPILIALALWLVFLVVPSRPDQALATAAS
jgi:hypothetical protein